MSAKRDRTDKEPEKRHRKRSVRKLLLSLLAGLVGVQSDQNRESDFSSGSIWPFVIGGVLFTAVLVLSLIGLVLLLTP